MSLFCVCLYSYGDGTQGLPYFMQELCSMPHPQHVFLLCNLKQGLTKWLKVAAH